MSRKTVKWIALGLVTVAVGVLLRVTGIAGVILTPLQTYVTTAVQTLDIGGWRAAYESAQAELSRLRQELAQQEDAVHTAAFYRQFLALKDVRREFALCDARIIAADTDTFMLNVGEVDGVHAGMAVMTVSGLAGTIAETGLSWARMHPLTHSEVTVSVTVCRTGEIGEMTGGVITLPRGSAAVPGDRVMTSGLGGTYPRGLLIGEVGTITADTGGLSCSAPVTRYAACEGLVMVITGF